MRINIGLGRVALVAAFAQLAIVQQGFASGYEKGIMWGGRTAGVAGIASPYIAGSQAIYFNPAGLANDKEGHDVSFNLSLLSPKFKGPIANDNSQATSKDTLLTPLGLTYDYSVNDSLGIGVGYYVSGGSNAKFENINVDGAGNLATINTDLMISEIAVGAGYKLTDDLKVGIAYRIVMAKAEFGLVNRVGAVLNTRLTDLKDTNYGGFKVGVQYRLTEHTKLGFNYRSETNFKADGTSTAVQNNTVQPGRSATAETTFPMQAQLGIMHEYTEWRALAEYNWSQYSRVGEIQVRDTATGGANYVPMKWKDEHQVRLGGEYLGISWPVRFGYAWTSAVTDKDLARASFAPPASANTLTLGTGQIFQVASNPLQFDIAGEYTFASGDGGTAAAGSTAGDFRAGTYEVSAMALHAGLTYAF